ncbi:MAG: MYXO-CTERM sorting domain-containing protein [Phycisphaerales bacterium]
MKNTCAIAALMLLGTGAWADVVDDFESYTVGESPAGIWQDASSFIVDPTNPGPTVAVIGTTDASGNATQAVQIQDGLGTSGGILGQVQHTDIQRVEMDLRLDQIGNGSNPNWIAAAGFAQVTEQDDINSMPQAFVYADKNSNRFRLFVNNGDGGPGFRDFGLGANSWELDTWYRIVIEVDTQAGVFEVSIVNGETGDVLTDITRTYNGWNSDFGQYDLIGVIDGEYGASVGTVANMASIDNVSYVPAPGTLAAGMLGLGALGRRRRN